MPPICTFFYPPSIPSTTIIRANIFFVGIRNFHFKLCEIFLDSLQISPNSAFSIILALDRHQQRGQSVKGVGVKPFLGPLGNAWDEFPEHYNQAKPEDERPIKIVKSQEEFVTNKVYNFLYFIYI